MSQTIVVVGGGHSAGQAVGALRAEGFEGKIVLVAQEPHLPYQRPPLSKAFLAGELETERLFLKPQTFYEKADVELLLGRRVQGIDRAARTVTLDDGHALPYDKLLLATGSIVRTLNIRGADLPGAFYLRTIEQSASIKRRLQPGARVVIVGGGYIGLEVASVAATAGTRVTVLEMAPHVMARVVHPRVGDMFARVHREHGVDIRTGVKVTAFHGKDEVEEVSCDDGSRIEADTVVVGVGVSGNTDLAERSGLACDNGIVVDAYTRTGDPHIFASGDCTNHPNPLLGRRLRLESVHNATAQARAAASNLCGKQKAYAELPWFWSDQYDLKLQIAGLSEADDALVVRGDLEAPPYSAFHLRRGKVVAVNTVNNPKEFMAAKTLILSDKQVDADRLADSAVELGNL